MPSGEFWASDVICASSFCSKMAPEREALSEIDLDALGEEEGVNWSADFDFPFLNPVSCQPQKVLESFESRENSKTEPEAAEEDMELQTLTPMDFLDEFLRVSEPSPATDFEAGEDIPTTSCNISEIPIVPCNVEEISVDPSVVEHTVTSKYSSSPAMEREVVRRNKRIRKHRDSFQERIEEALRLISRMQVNVLVQVWMPYLDNNSNKLFLTTREQPYTVQTGSDCLHLYRNVSTCYVFPAESREDACLGLPGRVFVQRSPEWSPNVQYYDSHEYLRFRDAARYDVKGSLAVPVFEPSSRSCLAVIELVRTNEQIEFCSEMNSVCAALQAVNLSSAEGQNLPLAPGQPENRQAALEEIAAVLTAICETHKLPLAQAWLPDLQIESVEKSDVNGGSHERWPRLFTKYAPCHVSDGKIWGFRQACEEHSLEAGQGVVGKAFLSNQPFFVNDMRCYSKTEYPLGHYARLFGLVASVAIRLRSIYTGNENYVLEFFLPPTCTDLDSQHLLLNALSLTMQHACKSLRTVTDGELMDESKVLSTSYHSTRMSDEALKWPELNVVRVSPGVLNQEHAMSHDESSSGQSDQSTRNIEMEQESQQDQIQLRHSESFSTGVDNSVSSDCTIRKRTEKKRNTAEKTIGLDVLQKYFAGSLKDAARSIGVCPTTLKRICRQHGISRWPSRKINKVSRSLQKLQGVIDSVQGIDGQVRVNVLPGDLASAAAAAASMARQNAGSIGNQGKPGVFARNQEITSSSTSHFASAAKIEFTNSLSPIITPPLDIVRDGTNGSANGRLQEGQSFMTSSLLHSMIPTQEQSLAILSDPNIQPTVKPSLDGTSAEKRNASRGRRVHGSVAAITALKCIPEERSNIISNLECKYEPDEAASSPDGLSRTDHPNSPADCGRSLLKRKMSLDDLSSITVKATFRSDTIRFKLPHGSGFEKVQEEICRRFKLEAESFSLKYLDDEKEWVMLDCDADLQECLDVMRSTNVRTIKLVVRDSSSNNNIVSHSSSSW